MFFIAIAVLLASSGAFLLHQYRSGAFADDPSSEPETDAGAADSDLKAA